MQRAVNLPKPSRIRPEDNSIVRSPGLSDFGISMTAGLLLDDIWAGGGDAEFAFKFIWTFSVLSTAADDDDVMFVVESGAAAAAGGVVKSIVVISGATDECVVVA